MYPITSPKRNMRFFVVSPKHLRDHFFTNSSTTSLSYPITHPWSHHHLSFHRRCAINTPSHFSTTLTNNNPNHFMARTKPGRDMPQMGPRSSNQAPTGGRKPPTQRGPPPPPAKATAPSATAGGKKATTRLKGHPLAAKKPLPQRLAPRTWIQKTKTHIIRKFQAEVEAKYQGSLLLVPKAIGIVPLGRMRWAT